MAAVPQPAVSGSRGWRGGRRRARLTALLAVGLIGLVLVGRATGLAVVIHGGTLLVGRWEPLHEQQWTYAQSSWAGIGFEDPPWYDETPAGRPLVLDGRPYAQGIGAVPTTELVYALDGRYALFRATVAVDDSTDSPESGARFLAGIDDALAFDSGPLRLGDPSQRFTVPVAGAQRLRLLTAPLPATKPAFGDWVGVRLLRPVLALGANLQAQGQALAQQQRQVRDDLRQAAAADLADLTARELRFLADVLPAGVGDTGRARGVVVPLDRQGGHRLVLANQKLAVFFDVGGGDHAWLTLVDRQNRRLVARGVGSTVILRDFTTSRRIDLHRDTQPATRQLVQFSDLDDPVFGGGKTADIPLRTVVDHRALHVRLSLLDDRPVLLVALFAEQADELFGRNLARFLLLDGGQGAWYVGDGAEYVTDFNRWRHGEVRDDGVARRTPVTMGAPIILRGGRLGGGVLLTAVDEQRHPARWSILREPGQPGAQVSFQTDAALARPAAPEFVASPRLYIEVAPSPRLVDIAGHYREAMARLYPAPPLPSWFRYQWSTQYAHGMAISAATLREQIDFLADRFGDLGPWLLAIDAGWNVSEGREGADWRQVDQEKFPNGLQPVVAHAHARGLRVMLSFSAPYYDAQARPGNAVGLKGLIEGHPGWFIRLARRPLAEAAVFNFSHPGARGYVREVFADFFTRYGVDGVRLDGIGKIGQPRTTPLDELGLAEPIMRQTMGIYRAVWEEAQRHRSDAVVAAGWFAPRPAAPYAHTWRFAADSPQFSASYPEAGLIERIDYAALQRNLLGLRPALGAALGDPRAPANRWLLGAALAMGAHVALSLDLREASPHTLATYRSLLAPYRPFEGRTILDQTLHPSVMATTHGALTFLGLLNRRAGPREFQVDLSAYGLDPGSSYVAYDVEAERPSRVQGTLQFTMPPRSFRLFVLRRTPGVIWGSSSHTVERLPGGLEVTLRGPPDVPGFLRLVTDPPRQVLLDGTPLKRSSRPDAAGRSYTYDEAAGVLRVTYPHRDTRLLRILY